MDEKEWNPFYEKNVEELLEQLDQAIDILTRPQVNDEQKNADEEISKWLEKLKNEEEEANRKNKENPEKKTTS
jgi:C4-type Zn-finger protein